MRIRRKPGHHVYLVTHVASGKRYVGKTSGVPRTRWQKHMADARGRRPCKHFHHALAKYGDAAFSWEVLDSFWTEREALDAEAWWIEFLRSYDRGWGFNIHRDGCGGVGHEVSKETREKIAAKARGRKVSLETRAKQSIAHKGKPSYVRTQTTREKIAVGLRGRKNGPLSDEHKAKLSAKFTGRAIPAEQRVKISASRTGKPLNAAQLAALDSAHEGARKPRSEETRRRMSEAAKRRWAEGGAEAFGLPGALQF